MHRFTASLFLHPLLARDLVVEEVYNDFKVQNYRRRLQRSKDLEMLWNWISQL